MSKAITIRKGLNIRLIGEAEKVLSPTPAPTSFSIQPADFHGVIPRLSIKEGDKVQAGDPLFRDKYNENILFCSPCSGVVTSVLRGEKRRILEIKLKPDPETSYKHLKTINTGSANRKEVLDTMLASGLWPFIRQRPFSVMADPNTTPKAIFISGFDSAPLAPDFDFVLHNRDQEFQDGLNALTKLTTGKVYLTLKHGNAHDNALKNAKGIEINTIKGPHPAGNVGVQIHHTMPVNKGDVIWYVHVQDVALIGRILTSGKFDTSRLIAVTGSEVKNPKYVKLPVGASVTEVLQGNISNSKVRVISGNPLTGLQIPEDGHVRFYQHQITVLPEITDDQFLITKGWLAPGFDKFSASRTFPTWLMPGKKYRLNTGNNGEKRAFVISGQYEQVFPFDIFPVHLLKACITHDLDGMERLGIYEVDPEDFALCEYVCTSKINSQEIVREALDLVRKECV
jgi:Na+-transporting NADH:ubiquinone oxidoreductase subunit A